VARSHRTDDRRHRAWQLRTDDEPDLFQRAIIRHLIDLQLSPDAIGNALDGSESEKLDGRRRKKFRRVRELTAALRHYDRWVAALRRNDAMKASKAAIRFAVSMLGDRLDAGTSTVRGARKGGKARGRKFTGVKSPAAEWQRIADDIWMRRPHLSRTQVGRLVASKFRYSGDSERRSGSVSANWVTRNIRKPKPS
jgi:hypothetical protein